VTASSKFELSKALIQVQDYIYRLQEVQRMLQSPVSVPEVDVVCHTQCLAGELNCFMSTVHEELKKYDELNSMKN